MTGTRTGGVGTSDPISVRIPEAIRLTGISRSRLYELMKSGDVEYAKVGASTLILLDSLRRFVENQRAASGSASLDGISPSQ